MERVRVTDFFTAAKGHSEKLQQAADGSEGQATLLVHPWYEPQPYTERYNYSSRLKKLLGKAGNSQLVIVFEERGNIRPLREKLSRSGASGQVFVVPTKERSSKPVERNGWDKLGETLRDLKVRKVVIAGQQLDIYHRDGDFVNFAAANDEIYFRGKVAHEILAEYARALSDKQSKPYEDLCCHGWIEHGMVPYGCVGAAASNLLFQGMDVQFSGATRPHTQKEFTRDPMRFAKRDLLTSCY